MKKASQEKHAQISHLLDLTILDKKQNVQGKQGALFLREILLYTRVLQ